jgi:hypothetical protein
VVVTGTVVVSGITVVIGTVVVTGTVVLSSADAGAETTPMKTIVRQKSRKKVWVFMLVTSIDSVILHCPEAVLPD